MSTENARRGSQGYLTSRPDISAPDAPPPPDLSADSSPSTADDGIGMFEADSNDSDHDNHVHVDVSDDGSLSTSDDDAVEVISLKPKPWFAKLISTPKIASILDTRYKNVNQVKLILMLVLTFSYFVAELLVGFLTGSLALVSDAFHMASDAIALIIAFIAIEVQKINKLVNSDL